MSKSTGVFVVLVILFTAVITTMVLHYNKRFEDANIRLCLLEIQVGIKVKTSDSSTKCGDIEKTFGELLK